MANLILNYENYSIMGDGVSLVATIYLPSVPVSADFISAIDVSGGDPVDVSVNVSSTVLSGATVTVNFVAPFTGPIVVTLNVLGFMPLSDSVTVLNFPASQVVTLASTTITGSVAVTGTFFQATQPVSIATMPSTPVTGTFWQAIQPVSGTVTADQGTSPWIVSGVIAAVQSGTWNIDSITTLPAITIAAAQTIGVTGTFWQATQPISGAISFTAPQHVISDTGSVVAVSNFPASQVVSGTITANQGTSPWVVSLASTTITGSVAVTGTFWQATQPVSGTFWQATQPVSGTITANQGTSPWVVSNGGTFAVQASITTLGQQLAAGSVPVVLTAAQIVALTPLSTVAVTQGTSPWVVSLASTTVTNIVSDNLVQVAGVALGATAVTPYGTTPAAVNVPAVNAFITNVPTVNQGTSPWVASLGNSTGKTVKMLTGTLTTTAVTANQVVLTYTVTAGKTFYLQYVKNSSQFTVTPGNGNPIALGTISLESPALTKLYSVLAMYATDQTDLVQFAEPIPFAAGTVIRLVVTPASATSMLWVGNFGGYEK